MKKIIFLLTLLFLLGNSSQKETFAQDSSQSCHHETVINQEDIKYFTQSEIMNLIRKYPELDFKNIDYSVVSQAEMGGAHNAGETQILRQKFQQKRTWSDGRVEILKEWEEITVPSMKLNGEKKMTQALIEYTWVHEQAHVFYYRYLTEEQRSKWETLNLSSKTSVTTYGGTSAEEDFAEWFTFYFYPPVFAKKECFTGSLMDSNSGKNKFMAEIKNENSERFGWLTSAQTLYNNLKANPDQEIKPSVSEQFAREVYGKQNGYANYFTSAPKIEPEITIPPEEETEPPEEEVTIPPRREVPDFINNYIQKRKQELQKFYLQNARELSGEAERDAFLQMIGERRSEQ